MKFSEQWLREWINPNISSTDLQNQIIDCGLEIELIKKFDLICNTIIVGQVIKCCIHPHFKNLKILKVDIGNKKILNIVCGALNCRNNIKVAVAKIGSILPNQLKIDLKNVRGIVSEGMLCSFFELGLFNDNNNIIEFPSNVSIGTNVKDYFALKDNIMKISTTPNRPDGLSILGIARNIAAVNNLENIKLKPKNTKITLQDKYPIYIHAQSYNINFSGRILNNVNMNVDTPFWMKKKLFFCDMLSDNIIENIINYILIEIGQPLNAINADNIDRAILARMSRDQEILYINNQKKIILDKKILVFSDEKKILFIPGNVNSINVTINKKTKNIFLCSYFVDKKFIFDIFQKINDNKILDYYNHGIDTSLQKYALEYATYLISKICGGGIGPISYNTTLTQLNTLNTIQLNYKKVNKLIGFTFNTSLILNILLRLEYIIINVQKQYLNVTPPNWRFDILTEEDVISDILRIYNYNRIPLYKLKKECVYKKKNNLQEYLLSKASLALIQQGYYEIITYSFVDPDFQNNIFLDVPQLLISNPISKDFSSMRLSLWPGLLKSVAYNTKYKQNSIRLFERGFCFSIDKTQNLGIHQKMLLGGAISGFWGKENWFSKNRKVDFYDLKGDLEVILNLIDDIDCIEFKPEKILGLHPNQSANIYINNILVGRIGKIDPRLEKILDISSSTFLFELSFNNIINIKSVKIQNFSHFPNSRRDIAILIKKDIPYSEIIKTCRKCFINKIVDINLFDVYFCKEISLEYKSLGISFVFQDINKTLEDNEINLMLDNCINTLKSKFHVILRT